MAKRRRPKPEIDAGSIEEVSDEVAGKIAVKYTNDALAEGVTSIACGHYVYPRRHDGSFLIHRKDLEDVARQGLVKA